MFLLKNNLKRFRVRNILLFSNNEFYNIFIFINLLDDSQNSFSPLFFILRFKLKIKK